MNDIDTINARLDKHEKYLTELFQLVTDLQAEEPTPDTSNAEGATIVQYTGEPLHEMLARLVSDEESQADAARQYGIGKAYLSRLLSGAKSNPSDDVLSRMGIQRRTTIEYWFKKEKA
jgi:hypothetical protein